MTLTLNQALNVLIQAVHKAQQVGGVFTLDEAATVNEAVKVFMPQPPAPVEAPPPAEQTPVETPEVMSEIS